MGPISRVKYCNPRQTHLFLAIYEGYNSMYNDRMGPPCRGTYFSWSPNDTSSEDFRHLKKDA